MENIKQILEHKYGFVENEDGVFISDFCLAEFFRDAVNLTHPVTKMRYEISNEMLIFSEVGLLLDEFLFKMLEEDRVNEEVAYRVIEDEGWSLHGGEIIVRPCWEKDNLLMLQYHDKLLICSYTSYTPNHYAYYSEFRSTLHLRKWLKETTTKVKLMLL